MLDSIVSGFSEVLHAWSQWRQGKLGDTYELLGVPMFWWARFGKMAAVPSIAVLIVWPMDPERLSDIRKTVYKGLTGWAGSALGGVATTVEAFFTVEKEAMLRKGAHKTGQYKHIGRLVDTKPKESHKDKDNVNKLIPVHPIDPRDYGRLVDAKPKESHKDKDIGNRLIPVHPIDRRVFEAQEDFEKSPAYRFHRRLRFVLWISIIIFLFREMGIARIIGDLKLSEILYVLGLIIVVLGLLLVGYTVASLASLLLLTLVALLLFPISVLIDFAIMRPLKVASVNKTIKVISVLVLLAAYQFDLLAT
jgi:hypothetical protein